MTSSTIEFLLNRKSAPIAELKGPGPDDAEIRTLLTIAARVPDHGRLAPWRFILYRGDARERIGVELAALAQSREGPLTDARQAQELTRFSRAPLVIGIVHVPRDNPKIPQWEMVLSGGAVAMNLLTAATAMGYGANWITNWYSDVAEGRAILGLEPQERVIGFIHIGNFEGEAFERPRPDIDALTTEFGKTA